MISLHFTAADILAPAENEEPADSFEAQLLASDRQCMADIIATEGKPRQLTWKEDRTLAQFVSGHQGNPLGLPWLWRCARVRRRASPFSPAFMTSA